VLRDINATCDPWLPVRVVQLWFAVAVRALLVPARLLGNAAPRVVVAARDPWTSAQPVRDAQP